MYFLLIALCGDGRQMDFNLRKCVPLYLVLGNNIGQSSLGINNFINKVVSKIIMEMICVNGKVISVSVS